MKKLVIIVSIILSTILLSTSVLADFSQTWNEGQLESATCDDGCRLDITNAPGSNTQMDCTITVKTDSFGGRICCGNNPGSNAGSQAACNPATPGVNDAPQDDEQFIVDVIVGGTDNFGTTTDNWCNAWTQHTTDSGSWSCPGFRYSCFNPIQSTHTRSENDITMSNNRDIRLTLLSPGNSVNAKEVTISCTDTVTAVCGNGIVEAGEDCELPNTNDADSRSCGTDEGICQSGTQYRDCDNNCQWDNWESCQGEIGPNPAGEICTNGLDDDCDGEVDEADCVSLGTCEISNAQWNTTCVGAGLPIELQVDVTETNDTAACDGATIQYVVYEEDTTSSDDLINNTITDGSLAGVDNGETYGKEWISQWHDDEGIGGPEFYFSAGLTGGLPAALNSSADLEVRACDVLNDEDCDGVNNLIDDCPGTAQCVPGGVDSRGCASGSEQSFCAGLWDCSNVPWSFCGETVPGKITRTVGNCDVYADLPTECSCTFSGTEEDFNICSGFTLVNERTCLAEEEFPVFTWVNVLVVLGLLGAFYAVRRKA